MVMMTYILILLVAGAMLALGLAKKRGKKRSMGRYIKGNVDEDFALGTLAGNTAILEASQVVGERTRITSIDCSWTLSDFTPGDNVGPIECGVAHSDYSLAEIEEVLEATSSWNEGDKISQEIQRRLVRRIGVFQHSDALEDSVLNEGQPIKTRLNWILNAGQGLNFWVYNQGSGSLATTDPNMHIVGHANLFPQ